MGDLVKSVLRPILAAVMAVLAANSEGCKPPGGDELETIYRAELTQCVKMSQNKLESCLCRKAVDEKWGLCDRPEWPRIGRCDFMCEGN